MGRLKQRSQVAPALLGLLLTCFFSGGASAQGASAPGNGEAVYRCPGPPITYTDAITIDQATARGCVTVRAAPVHVLPQGKQARPRPAACPLGNGMCDVDWASPVGSAPAPASAPEVRQPAKLGPVDAWRYRRCQEQAAQAPTVVGVREGMRLCREQFDQ